MLTSKFHCEFSFIELCWGEAKRTTRQWCVYKFNAHKKSVARALLLIDIGNMRRYSERAEAYIAAYCSANDHSEAHRLVREQSAARRKQHRSASKAGLGPGQRIRIGSGHVTLPYFLSFRPSVRLSNILLLIFVPQFPRMMRSPWRAIEPLSASLRSLRRTSKMTPTKTAMSRTPTGPQLQTTPPVKPFYKLVGLGGSGKVMRT